MTLFALAAVDPASVFYKALDQWCGHPRSTDSKAARRRWSLLMCNDFGNHVPYNEYLTAFRQTRIPVKWPSAAPNLEPREDIWPTDPAPVIRRLEDATNAFTIMLGLSTGTPKGPPGHKFPFREAPVPGRQMSRPGVLLL
jgi:hypothetical protein